MDAVHRYEGTVNQVLGMASWRSSGLPWPTKITLCGLVTLPWPCRRPCAVMREEVRRSHGLEMLARVGLHSGEVVVRSIGNDLHMDYSAVGQTRTWRRVWSSSPPWQYSADRRHPPTGRGTCPGQRPSDRFRSKGLPSPWRFLSWSGPVRSAGACRPVRARGLTASWDGSKSWRRYNRPWSGRGRAWPGGGAGRRGRGGQVTPGL